MKIGILQCCSVLPQFQPQFGDYPDMFKAAFRDIDATFEYQVYDILKNEFPTDVNECDAYITTGSRRSTYEILDWIAPLKKLFLDLDQAQKKLVGICFGHQLLADTFGGRNEKSNKGWGVGISQNKILLRKSWMKPPLEVLNIIVSHQDQISELPPEAELLASSDFCPYYMIQLGENILSIQGHPEFSKEYSRTLMQHRVTMIGEPTLSIAEESLKLEVHSRILMQWIINFLTHNRS